MQPRLGAGDCERLRTGCLAQPTNTLTSAAYIVAAAVVLARLGRTASEPVLSGPVLSGPVPARPPRSSPSAVPPAWVFAGTCAVIGVGSVAFHGPQPRGASWMHDLPIAAMLGLLVGTTAVRVVRRREPFPGRSKRRGFVIASLGAAAGIAYVAGRTGARTCDPNSRWQWHGVWHVLSAAALVVAGEALHGSDRAGS